MGYKIAIMWNARINAVWLTALQCAQTHKPGCFQLVQREKGSILVKKWVIFRWQFQESG